MKGEGDCFPVAWRLVYDSDDLVLVHGTVVGQGPIEGVHHEHAWCERTDVLEFPGRNITTSLTMVVDQSNGQEIEMPAVLYYRIGQIYDVTYYDREEALTMVLRHKHYGPWPPAVGGDSS